MKKINPKITSLVVALLSILIAGGVATKEVLGDPDISPAESDGTGSGLW